MEAAVVLAAPTQVKATNAAAEVKMAVQTERLIKSDRGSIGFKGVTE